MLVSYLKMVLGVTISGSLGVFIKNIAMDRGQIMAIRTFLGGVFLTLVFILGRREFSWVNLKKNLLKLMVSGSLFGISGLFIFLSYDAVGVAMSSIIYSLNPVFIFTISIVILGEKFSYKKALGLIISLIGLFLVNGFRLESLSLNGKLSYGLIAAILYGLMAIINKKVEGLDSILITIVQLFAASISLGIYLGLKGELALEIPSGNGLLYLLIVSFLHTGYAMKLYYEGIQNLPAQSVALISYMEALSAILASSLILKESLNFHEILGALLIIGGALAGEILDNKSKKEVKEW